MQKLSPVLFLIFILFNSCNTAKKSADISAVEQPGFEQFYIAGQQAETTVNKADKPAAVADEKTGKILQHAVKANNVESPEEEQLKPAINKKSDLIKLRGQKQTSYTLAQKTPVEKNSDALFLICTALTAIGLGLVFSSVMSAHSKKISFYAFNNRRNAVYIIAASHIAIGLMAIFLGRNLAELGIRTTEICTNVLSALACASAIFYPIRKVKKGLFKPSYMKQKAATLLVLLSGFALLTNIGIETSVNPSYSPATACIYDSYDKCFDSPKDNNITNTTAVAESNKSKGDGDQVALTILLFLVCLLLLGLVAGLACTFACSDMGAVAALITIGGLALTIFLFVSGWRRIWS